MQHRLLRASAGTGKTYQLVQAYVALVLEQGLKPSEIVAITFTRKAAMELKLRIRKKLQEAGVGHDVLTDLSRAPISNFHGLALQLLRQCAFAGGLTSGSRILGEAGDDLQLFLDACEGAWFSGDAECAAAIESVATCMSVDTELPLALWTAVGRAREDGRAIDTALWGAYDPPARQAASHEALMSLRETLIRDGSDITGAGKDKLAALARSPIPDVGDDATAWGAAWRTLFKCIDRRGKLGAIYSKEQAAGWVSAIDEVVAEHHCVATVPALETLLRHAWARYEAAKQALHAVDFADIIARLVTLLETDATLHMAVRQRLSAVLVDEAQDTNRLQRRMVHLLAGLTGPAADHTTPASLFVVGDWKQSIYTFRGADPESFALFAADLKTRGGEETTLSVSRRSAPALVHGINDLGVSMFDANYEHLAPLEPDNSQGERDREGAKPSERPASAPPSARVESPDGNASARTDLQSAPTARSTSRQSRTGSAASGQLSFASFMSPAPFVLPGDEVVACAPISRASESASLHSVTDAPRSSDLSNTPTSSDLPNTPPLSDLPNAAVEAPTAGLTWYTVPPPDPETGAAMSEPQAVARVVRARIDAGARPGDFAVLLTAMTVAPLFARALADVGIAAVLGGGGGLYQQPEVVDTIALLSWLCDRKDRLNAAVALRSPLIGLSDEALLTLCHAIPNTQHGLDALHRGHWPLPGRVFQGRDARILERLAATLPALTDAAQDQSAAALFLDVDEALDARAIYLGMPGGEQRMANLNRLLNLAERFGEAQRGTAARFVRQQQDRIRRGHAEPLTPVPTAARQAVTISSVHQSKGLQYPVVILTNLARTKPQDSASVRYGRAEGLVFKPKVDGVAHKSSRCRRVEEQDKAVQSGELRRLMYVAITRPEREILFVGPSPETLKGEGFGGLLNAWAPQALHSGVLAQAEIPDAPTSPPPTGVEAAVTHAAVDARLTQTLNARMAHGTHFDLSVTQLAAEAYAPRVPSAQPLSQQLKAGLTFDPDGERDPPLDPLSRGRLAHQVLAAMPRRSRHDSDATFIASELNMAGFADDDARLTEVKADVAHFLSTALGAKLLALPTAARRHELPFAMPVDAVPYKATLHGQIDLLAWDEEGPLLVDYKHAHQSEDIAPYLLQLDTYAAAVAELCNHDGPIRSYLVFLRDRNEPYAHTITPPMRQNVATQAANLARRLATTGGLS